MQGLAGAHRHLWVSTAAATLAVTRHAPVHLYLPAVLSIRADTTLLVNTWRTCNNLTCVNHCNAEDSSDEEQEQELQAAAAHRAAPSAAYAAASRAAAIRWPRGLAAASAGMDTPALFTQAAAASGDDEPSPVASMMAHLQAHATQELLGLGGSTPLEPRQLQQQQEQAIQLTPLDTPELDTPPTGMTCTDAALLVPSSSGIDPLLPRQRCIPAELGAQSQVQLAQHNPACPAGSPVVLTDSPEWPGPGESLPMVDLGQLEHEAQDSDDDITIELSSDDTIPSSEALEGVSQLEVEDTGTAWQAAAEMHAGAQGMQPVLRLAQQGIERRMQLVDQLRQQVASMRAQADLQVRGNRDAAATAPSSLLDSLALDIDSDEDGRDGHHAWGTAAAAAQPQQAAAGAARGQARAARMTFNTSGLQARQQHLEQLAQQVQRIATRSSAARQVHAHAVAAAAAPALGPRDEEVLAALEGPAAAAPDRHSLSAGEQAGHLAQIGAASGQRHAAARHALISRLQRQASGSEQDPIVLMEDEHGRGGQRQQQQGGSREQRVDMLLQLEGASSDDEEFMARGRAAARGAAAGLSGGHMLRHIPAAATRPIVAGLRRRRAQ
jgi:hypothetical protein